MRRLLSFKWLHAKSAFQFVVPPSTPALPPARFVVTAPALLLALALLWLFAFASKTHAQSAPVTLNPTADTYVKDSAPNQNQGTETVLRVRATDKNRTLVQFDQAAIANAVGTSPLGSAKLRLYVTSSSNLGSNRIINAHRLTQAWTERGATWNCPDDTNTVNGRPDCDPSWELGAKGPVPFAIAPTAVARHQNGQVGWVEWDVTADVAGFLGGSTSNHGWILRFDDERRAGQVTYSSREGSFSPELVISVGGSGPPPPSNLTSRGDTYLRKGAPNQNSGNALVLRVQEGGDNRALVQFDPAAINTAVGSGTLVSAKLRLRIVLNLNNWGSKGREVNAHRMTRAWTEQGATWNCPDDTNPFNAKPDCQTAWEMGTQSRWPFVATRTAAIVQHNKDTGWVEWDVTPDVQMFLNGTAPNYGWVVRKDKEDMAGHVEYSSREGEFAPVLALTVSGPPPPPTPVITSVVPNTGQQGQVLSVAVTGQNTHFVQGTSQVNLGADITINTVTVTDTTHLNAQITIALNATIGPRAISVTTGTETAPLNNGFTVQLAPTPIITLLNPNSGQQGKGLSVAITGQDTHFLQGSSQVTFGDGITVGTVTVADSTHLTAQITIAADAVTGARTVTVTTNAEVVPLNSGFTVEAAATPIISLVNPNAGQQGQSLPVAITGQNTNFAQGTSQVSFGTGVTVGTVTVADATHLSAQITIGAGAAIGPRTVSVTTGTEVAPLDNGFTVASPAAPLISDFNPKSAPVGTLVNVQGSNLQPASGLPQVTLSKQRGGTLDSLVSNVTPTSLAFVIPTGTASGPFTVTVSGQSAPSPSPLTIVASSQFTLRAEPASAVLFSDQSVSYAVSLESSNGFSQLASLSVGGLPGGVTASFKPQQLTAGQTSVLTVQAPAAQPVSSSTLEVTATATVQGILVSQKANVQLAVQAASTSFVGRTVVDDALQTPLAHVTVTMLGKNGNGGTTGCTGSTISDEAGNFALTGLAPECVGQQLVGYDGLTATSPEGKYAGVDLVYTLASGQVTASPVLVHLPRIDDKEVFNVIQNASEDQSYSFKSIPGVSVTVYRGTTFKLPDGSTPDPFPLVAINIPVDRLPEAMPQAPNLLNAFIVAFQPANAEASRPVAVSFPNVLNTRVGRNMTLMTLDPTRGRMVPYGTGTVSIDGTQVVPDPDPAFSGARYGLVHFDWHGQMDPLPNDNPDDPNPDICPLTVGQPVDLSSGLETINKTDISFGGLRGSISIVRTYRTLSNFAGPFGIGTNHNYGHRLDTIDPVNALAINLIMPDGNRLLFSRQSLDQPLRNSTSPAMQGAVITTLPAAGAQLRWKDGTVYRFTPTGVFRPRLESITDANGNIITLTRNSGQPDQITQITDAVGRSLNLAYDGANRITSITDPIGRTIQYTYNTQGTLETVTDPEGGVTRYEYDSQNRLVKETDPRNIVVAQNTYEEHGRVLQQVQADGGVFKFAYTFVNPTVSATPVLSSTMTDPLGKTTAYRFDPAGFLTDVKDHFEQTRLVLRAPGTNQVTGYKGSAACRSCGAPSAGDQEFKYDDKGNVIEQKDALGNATTYTYEPVFNKVASIRDPLGNTSSFTYDDRGNLLSRTDANGKTTSYKYDSNGLLTETTDPLGQKTTFAYDNFGNLISITDALGNKTQFRYDGISRQVEIMDALGRRSQTEYDKLGRVVRQTDARGKVTQFEYDAAGNLLSLTDARGKKTTFTYDAMNQLKTRTTPLGRTDTRNYDQNGNLISFTDRRGQTSTYTYDDLNRLVSETYLDSNVTRKYDPTGRLVEVADLAGGALTFAYDLAGRLLSSTGPFGTVQYERDALGRVKTREVIGQPAVSYNYDPAGSLLSAAIPGASVAYTYDPRNQPLTITRANGVTTEHSYDPVGRLLSIVHSRGATALNSLTYSYDATGNRTSQQTSTGQPLQTQPAMAAYDDGNRLIQRGNTTFTYDDNGNLASENGPSGITTYTWDSRNRLKSITGPTGQTTDLQYDFTGNLIRQIDSGPTLNRAQTFVLDEITNVAYQSSSDGNTFSILTGQSIDSHWATLKGNGEVEYALANALNSTVATVDQTGSVKGTFFYEPFGQTTASGSSLPFQFTGRVPVSSSLYYYRARFYDSVLGRFVSEDPIGFAGGINSYSYVTNRPVEGTDPKGLRFQITFDTRDSGTPVPPPSERTLPLVLCIAVCMDRPIRVTSTTRGGEGAHPEGRAVDLSDFEGHDTHRLLFCASECGAACALDERNFPIEGVTQDPHVHVSVSPCNRGPCGRGELPPRRRTDPIYW